jgi:hypothetical protein
MSNRREFKKFKNSQVAGIFENYPKQIRSKLLFLRQLIFDTAFDIAGVGELEETLRWGEPTYLTTQSQTGSMVRINAKGPDGQYGVYFHCQTNLVERFRERYAGKLKFQNNRAIIFGEHDAIPVKELKHCIAQALTYHRDRIGRKKIPNSTRRKR